MVLDKKPILTFDLDFNTVIYFSLKFDKLSLSHCHSDIPNIKLKTIRGHLLKTDHPVKSEDHGLSAVLEL